MKLLTVPFLALIVSSCAARSTPVATTPPAATPTPATASAASSTPTTGNKPFEPTVGQAGRDVVWVPTSPALVEKMLDMAKLTPADYVIDLGSGDGRNIIAAAKRGANGHGVEFNPDMVALSERLAREAGVADRAKFIQGDMYEADISKATVLALFLLPSNLDKLADKFLALPPGTRIVMNTFTVTGWEPDQSERLERDCVSWCQSLLYIVPANVAGTWRFDDGREMTLTQTFQMIQGTLPAGASSGATASGRLLGAEVTITAGDTTYKGRVDGNRMTGTATTGTTTRPFSATRTTR
jgi:SAM-dependent methyltransferase